MDKQELLNRYFEHSLLPEEEAVLLNALEVDPMLRQEFEFRKNLQIGLHRIQRQTDKKMLQDWESEIVLPSDKNIRPVRGIRLIQIAAVFTGLLIFYWLYQSGSSYNALYQQYYQPFPNIINSSVRSNANNRISDSLAKAFQLYDAGRYKEAFNYFQLQNENNRQEYTYFYAAICKMETGNMPAAIELFQIGNFTNDTLGLEGWSSWYTALAYIRLKQPEPAVVILKKLSQQNHVQAPSANKLLRSIE